MDRLTGVFFRGMVAAFCMIGCAAEQASSADRAGVNAGSGDVVASVEALRFWCRYVPQHPHCQRHECGDGTVDRREVCDDGNLEDGDGCSAQCQPDDDSSTPGDDRAGYVMCLQSDPVFTCGPDQGCCAQPNPGGPACAMEQSECGQNPTFQACDGPEDCEEGLHCVGTRFGNICGTTGYYWMCHTDTHCEQSRPVCTEVGVCREADVCGDGIVGWGEECDDGNTDGGDGCSASCEYDDISTTPGDDRAGYVFCGVLAPDLTCGPDQVCCAQGRNDDGNPSGPVCGADRSDCAVNPSFHACDGPEDCDDGVNCMGTRFGNMCGTGGYYRVCHSDADCESSQPYCRAGGSCGT